MFPNTHSWVFLWVRMPLEKQFSSLSLFSREIVRKQIFKLQSSVDLQC